MLALIQACLGLELKDASGEIAFYRPVLPPFLGSLHLRNLRMRGGVVDVLLQSHGDNVAVTQTRREGDVSVVVRY
jgi:hypothetical protein